MTDNNKHLVSAGHELASELKADCGAVDVRSVANLLTELASALDVQSARSEALAVERNTVNADNAYLRDQVLCWARECDRITYTYTNKVTDAHQSEAEQELANTLPAADAWVNEQQAKGVEKFVSDFTEPAVMNDGKFYSEDLIEASKEFAAQLRGSQV